MKKIKLIPVHVFNIKEIDGNEVGSHIEFRVVGLTNSTEYDIDQKLRREHVATLCEDDQWNVFISA